MEIISVEDIKMMQGWYYLREGDFLPERVAESKYRNDRMMLELFAKNGSIFPTRKEATAASNAIRAFLSVYLTQVQSTQQHQSTVAEPLAGEHQAHCNQHQCHSSSTQTRNLQTSACQQGAKFQGVAPRTLVINLFP